MPDPTPTPAPAPAQPAQPVQPVQPTAPPTLSNVFRLANIHVALEEYRIIGIDQLDEVGACNLELTRDFFEDPNEFAQLQQMILRAAKKKARSQDKKEAK